MQLEGHSNDMLEANASRYGVFRVVHKTDGGNLLAIIREIDQIQKKVDEKSS
jgi:hypothetical protein